MSMSRFLKDKANSFIQDYFEAERSGQFDNVDTNLEFGLETVADYERMYADVSDNVMVGNISLRDIRISIVSDSSNIEDARRSPYFADLFDENGELYSWAKQ